jgi:hypothetical protein
MGMRQHNILGKVIAQKYVEELNFLDPELLDS